MPRLSFRALVRHLAGMPMLKVLIPFAVGVALALHFTLPNWYLVVALIVSGLTTLFLRSTLGLGALLLTIGWLGTSLRAPVPENPPLATKTSWQIRLTQDAFSRDGNHRSEGQLELRRDPASGRWQRVEGGVIVRIDTTYTGPTLHEGDRIVVQGRIYPFRHGSASFRRLMYRRGFLGSCYLTQHSVLEHRPATHRTLHQWAAQRLRAQCDTTQASAVVRAMTVADRTGLSQGLRTAYARSGMSHLLAVSGLHTGIVFLLVNAILWWLPLLRRGHILRNLLAIVALWLFVAAAGFPPSAIRAAVMCTLLQGALATSSLYGAMNGWAAAAVGMLLWNPQWIGDISFQLSFIAVAAILAWGVPLCRRCRTRSMLLNRVLQALIISLVASIATAPLVAYAFGIVSLIGLLLNPFVVILGSWVVAGGVCLLLPAPVGSWLSGPVLALAEWQNRIATAGAASVHGVHEYTLSTAGVTTIYLLFVAITLVAWSTESKKSVHLLP